MYHPQPKAWIHGNTLAVLGATWDFKPGVNRDTYADAYRKNPIRAERDYGANPPRSVQAGLHDPALVEEGYNPSRQSPVDEFGAFKPWFRGDPRFEYYMHIDMSKQRDNTGIGIAHYDMLEDVVVVDLAHTIERKEDWKLSFERIYHLIETLVNLNFCFKKMTFDSWQSYQMIEKLTNRGYPAGLYSVDRGTEAYDTMIELLITGKLDYYFQSTFIREFKNIKLYKGTKYDHGPGGSKDTSDGVAGAVVQCVKDRVGLSFSSEEVDRAISVDCVLDFEEFNDVEGYNYFILNTTSLSPLLKNRVRVGRIDVVDDRLIFLMGWHDRKEKKLNVEVYQIWEDFFNLERFTDMLLQLYEVCNLQSFSCNEYTPVDLITFLQDTGRKVSTSLSTRAPRSGRKSRVARASATTASVIRVMISQLKKGNLFIPQSFPLIKDLKFMTGDNMNERVFARALAGWTDFALREVTYGHMSRRMPGALHGGPAPINPLTSQVGANRPSPSAKSPMPSRNMRTGDTMMDAIRARYSDRMMGVVRESRQKKSSEDKKSPRSLPRPITTRRR